MPHGPGWSIGGAPLTAPSRLIWLTPVKPTPAMVAVVPCSTGVFGLILMVTRISSGWSGRMLISSTLPTGTPEKVTAEPLASPSTDVLNRMS